MDGSSLKSLYSFKEGFGKQVRDTIHSVGQTIDPIVKKFIPNFRAAHYVYIISWCIVGSILVYPTHNLAYIDALFLATGSATQAGLNTTDGNLLKLYQQIVVYMIAMVTTPIFIHGSLLFVRLYWFERYFDNIKERSKLNFKMRREATLARTRTYNSFDPTMRNTYVNQGLGLRKRNSRATSLRRRSTGGMYSRTLVSNSAQRGNAGRDTSQGLRPGLEPLRRNSSTSSLSYRIEKPNNQLVEHLTEPSSENEDEIELSEQPHQNGSLVHEEHDSLQQNQEPEGIKFAELPHPSRRPNGHSRHPSNLKPLTSGPRRNTVDPSDMYRSIAIMQENKKQEKCEKEVSGINGDDDDDDDDVLIIRPPNEIENDVSGSIYTTKLSKKERANSKLRRSWKSRKWSSKFRNNFTNTQRHPRASSPVSEGADDEGSIDSEYDSEFQKLKEKLKRNDHNNEHAITDDEDEGNDGNDEEDKASKNADNHDEEEEEEENSDSSIISDDGSAALSSNDEDDENDENRENGDEDYFNYKGKYKEDLDSSSNSSPHLNIVLPDRHGTNTSDGNQMRSPTFDRFFSPAKNFGKKTRKSISKTTSRGLRKLGSGFIRSNSFAVSESNRVNTGPSINSHDGEEYDDYDNDDDDGGDADDGRSYYTDIENNSLRKMSTNYLSWNPTVGRNSTFINLSDDQKEELGGVEYRAVKLLIKILLVYYIGFHVMGVVAWVPYILKTLYYKHIVNVQGLNAVWWAIFTAQSSFNDLGLTVTANSMAGFSNSVYILVWSSFFIVIGNTGFPIFLRFLIWIMFKLSKPLSLFNESLAFLLDHPRRCFTLLFPSVPTWWLFIVLVVLNCIDLLLFIVLDLNSDYLKKIPIGYRILDGLYQAFSTRTAGFTVVDLSQLHPAVQVSYMLMMYISVLPLAISIRRTNVYEEQSLGVYLKEQNPEHDIDESKSSHFIGAHLRNQLSFDLWFIFLGLFIICIAEGNKLDKNNPSFSVFAILFEIISAYGTVGLSLGYPGTNTSFSAQFTTLSKLVIIAMMIRGRHRGLPYSLDRAIMLPNKMMAKRDHVQQEHAIRRNTTMDSRGNTLFRNSFSFDAPNDVLSTSGSSHLTPNKHSDRGLLRRVITSGGDIFENPGRVLLNRKRTTGATANYV
ncbi:low affinity potassium transporter [Scheffersomyces spartinae]|uniref:Potassium transport protein n=1 Tax=Scheffersomyces spartinae TaxID=45513 RepID=A0A9P7VAV3_9ASCO|nr:low affinity potassium transporter [Scheffersomyces spartinae]KAG7194403.1 low affinity potassium transporter [Scheffersomyces spartinae]